MSAPDWLRLPSLSALRAFEAAARLGGFSAAGRALNVTHAAVAQQVRALEADLGVTLLRRDGRGLALTEEGTHLARSLREGFGAIAAGVQALRDVERRRGLRVTATPAFAQSVLLPQMGDFWRHHADVAVSITPERAIVDLARDGFDVAIRSGVGPWPGVAAETLMEGRILLVGAPSLLAEGRPLAELPWLLDPDDPAEGPWLRAAGLDPQSLRISGLDSPMLAVPAARAGYGLLFATDVVVQDDLREGRLRSVPFPGLPRFGYWVVTRPGPRRPAVERFVTWLHARFGTTRTPVSRETRSKT